jgi:hypothetical protein
MGKGQGALATLRNSPLPIAHCPSPIAIVTAAHGPLWMGEPMTVERAVVPMEDPQAALERAFIEEYLKTRGHTLRSLHDLPEDQVTALLRSASLYAAIKLAEVEARATYVHEIHGASSE